MLADPFTLSKDTSEILLPQQLIIQFLSPLPIRSKGLPGLQQSPRRSWGPHGHSEMEDSKQGS